tara:strand:- start:571 stop:699 length:129 start_codon:yes stop_codon:yes gene_type:complete
MEDEEYEFPELVQNGDFSNDANAHNYLVTVKGWIITDGGEAP